MTDDKKPREPLIGWMILEDYCEDMSAWDGMISFPDPTGANLAWQNPIKMIEYSALDHMANCFAAEQDKRLAAEKERDELEKDNEHLAQQTANVFGLNETLQEKLALAEKERDELRESYDIKARMYLKEKERADTAEFNLRRLAPMDYGHALNTLASERIDLEKENAELVLSTKRCNDEKNELKRQLENYKAQKCVQCGDELMPIGQATMIEKLEAELKSAREELLLKQVEPSVEMLKAEAKQFWVLNKDAREQLAEARAEIERLHDKIIGLQSKIRQLEFDLGLG